MDSGLPCNIDELFQMLHLKLPECEYELDSFSVNKDLKSESGNFGEVTFGTITGIPNMVACKTFNRTCDYTREIWREMETMILLKNPFCLNLIGYIINKSKLIMITPRMKMGSLNKYLTKLNGTQQTFISAGIAYGMMSLHNLNKIHLDLKPENILLDDNYAPKIADFGCIKNESTHTISIKNTPLYAPPELACILDDKNTSVTKQGDVYSFGLIMNAMMAREEPYADVKFSQLIQFLNYKIENKLPRMHEDTPGPLKDIILKCCKKEWEERPSFKEIFEKFKNHEISFPGTDFEEFDTLLNKYIGEEEVKKTSMKFEDFVTYDMREKTLTAKGTHKEIEDFVSTIDISTAEEILGQIEGILYSDSKNVLLLEEDQLCVLYHFVATIYGRGKKFAQLCKESRIQNYIKYGSEEYDSDALTISLYSAILNSIGYMRHIKLIVIPDSVIERFPERVVSFYSFVMKEVIENIISGKRLLKHMDSFMTTFLQRYSLFGSQCADAFFRIAFQIIDNINDEDTLFKYTGAVGNAVKGILEQERTPSEISAVRTAYRFISALFEHDIYEPEQYMIEQDLKNPEFRNEVLNYITAKNIEKDFGDVKLLIDSSMASAEENFTPAVLALLRLADDEENADYMLERNVFRSLQSLGAENPKAAIRLVLTLLKRNNAVFANQAAVCIISRTVEASAEDNSLQGIVKYIINEVSRKSWSNEMIAAFGNTGFFSKVALCQFVKDDPDLIDRIAMIILKVSQKGHIVVDMVNAVPLLKPLLSRASKCTKVLSTISTMLSYMGKDREAFELLVETMHKHKFIEKLKGMETNSHTKELVDEILGMLESA